MNKLLAIAAVALAPMSAGATIVDPGTTVDMSSGYYTGDFGLTPGATQSFTFNVAKPTRISVISFAGTGGSAGDLNNTMFGVNSADIHFSTPVDNGSTYSAQGSVPDFTATKPFSLVVTADASNSDSVSGGFSLKAMSPVPVPATGGLLLTAMGAGALVARRKRKAAA